MNQHTPFGYTPLATAAFREHACIVKALIDSGANADHQMTIHEVDEDFHTAPHSACESGQAPLKSACEVRRRHTASTHVVADADVDQKMNNENTEDWTALQLASVNGNVEIAKMLIEAGANIDWSSPHGSSPLSVAIEMGHTELTKALIAAGAAVNATSNCYPALFMASKAGHSSMVEVVQRLILAGADVQVSTPQGTTALHFASRAGNYEIVDALLRAGAEVNATNANADRHTALHYAAFPGHHDVAARLLSARANVNAICHTSYGADATPLDLAITFFDTYGEEKLSAMMTLLRKHGGEEGKKFV